MDNTQTPKPAQQPTSPSSPKPVLSQQPVMQSFNQSNHGPSAIKVLSVLLIMAALGVGSGYGAAVYSAQPGKSIIPKALNPNTPAKGQTYSNGDTSAFKDMAEGVLKTGGIDGEGQYHLVRTGGDSQNVYLTSSSLDLAKFVDQKVKVWGQTQTAQYAGWLMDVGKVEVE